MQVRSFVLGKSSCVVIGSGPEMGSSWDEGTQFSFWAECQEPLSSLELCNLMLPGAVPPSLNVNIKIYYFQYLLLFCSLLTINNDLSVLSTFI